MSKVADFIKKYGQFFVDATQGTKIFPSVKAAQAILETGAGEHFAGNNLFGIKANGKSSKYWKGDAIDLKTGEVIKGEAITITAGFRKYDTISDSIKDHSEFIYQNPRYLKVIQATTPEAQAQELQAAGYATDPNYAGKLIAIMDQNDLKKLDKKKR